MKLALSLCLAFTAVTASFVAAAGNTDALKAFQNQGKKIISAKGDLKQLRQPSGHCLAVNGDPVKTGAPVGLEKCAEEEDVKQLWRFDEEGRLTGSGLKCLALGKKGKLTIEECTADAGQQWSLKDKRLKNKGGQCLTSKLDKKGDSGKLVLAECADDQRWSF